MPLPRLGCVRAGGLEHAPDRPQREGDVGAAQVEADPAVRLRVGEQPGDQLACRPHEMVIGDPQLGQAAEMLRLIGARLLEEVLESRAVGPRRRGTGQGDGRLEDVRDQGLDEGLLGGEVAVERAHADAGRGRHIGHAGFEPLLLEDLTGRSEQALPVLLGVAAHRSDGRLGRPAPRLRLARIRRFHSAYPSGQSGALGPLVPLFLGVGVPVSLTGGRLPVSPQWSPRAWTPPTRPRAPGPASWRRCSRDGCRRNRRRCCR